MSEIELKARNLLASCLNEWGCHQEAGNVRDGDDLESYEFELRVIGQLLRFGFETGSGREAAALTPPDEPDQALLVSMAMLVYHGFGLLTPEQKQSQLREMRKLWDEVMGRGYYSPANRERYVAMLAARPEVP